MAQLKENQQQQQLQQQKQQRSEFEPEAEDVPAENNSPALSIFNPRKYQTLIIVILLIAICSILVSKFYPDPLGLRSRHLME